MSLDYSSHGSYTCSLTAEANLCICFQGKNAVGPMLRVGNITRGPKQLPMLCSQSSTASLTGLCSTYVIMTSGLAKYGESFSRMELPETA